MCCVSIRSVYESLEALGHSLPTFDQFAPGGPARARRALRFPTNRPLAPCV